MQTQRQSKYFLSSSGITSQFADVRTFRSVLNTRTSRRLLAAGEQSIFDNAHNQDSNETVAGVLNVKGEPLTVEAHNFIKINVQKSYYLS